MANLVSLKRKREFDAVFERGRKRGNRYLGVLVLSGEQGAGVRYGLIVSRKNAGNAVRRNLLRRRLREALRLLLTGVSPDLDVVLVARAGAVQMSFWDIVDVIQRGLPSHLQELSAANVASARTGVHP